MRYLELTLLLLAAILPFLTASKKDSFFNKNLLLLIIAGVFIGHATMEGIRWQMMPIYLILFLTIICLLKGYAYFKGNWFRKIAATFFLFLMVGVGTFLSKTLPVFELSKPTGHYEIGSQYLHFTSNEKEIITDEIDDQRELMIKVWYPAIVDNERRELYLNDGERQGFANKYGLPKHTFNYLDKVKTNTFVNPKIAAKKFPILIFSHGHYANATGYSALIEEIVSHGFIVLNINHTYESTGALFPSGQIKLYHSDYDKKHNNEAMSAMIWTAMENLKKATTKQEKIEAIKGTLKNYFASEITHRWTKDVNDIVEQIPVWATSTFLSNHIDTSKIGVFGHSQGGAAAGQALLENSKISAGINIDGVQWGNMVDTFLTKPFLLLSSDWPAEHPNFNELAYQNESQSDFYMAKIRESGHSNFMDIPFMINLPLINEAGDITPQKAIDLTAKMVVDFFDKYLKEKNVDLLKMSKKYPAVEIEKRE